MWRVLVVWMILVFPLVSIFSQNAIKLTKLTGGLSIPVYLCHAGDDRLFVIEKAGKIRILNNGIVSPVPFLDIVNKVNSRGNEQGLLGLAFHPDFKNNGLFYVNYNNKIIIIVLVFIIISFICIYISNLLNQILTLTFLLSLS